MKRTYELQLVKHIVDHRQMIFLTGPRQVGKTTLCQSLDGKAKYINWDNQDDRAAILEGPSHIAEVSAIKTLREGKQTILFDEIHKYSKWKEFLKGFFDRYEDTVNIVVTGSSRLDVFKRGGDSLMGRYFLYRLHPFSVREMLDIKFRDQQIQNPAPISKDAYDSLLQFGGFPEPCLKSNLKFYNRWKKLRLQQLFYEDIRDFAQVQAIQQIEMLSQILMHQVGQLINYSAISKKIRVSVDTIRRWISILNSLFFCFTIQPWHRNVPRSLIKQPKVYLWDWSLIQDKGAKNENFIASHLKKAIDWWNDNGYGDYNLFFLRDKEKKEVDFLVTRDGEPWFLVEVKSGQTGRISKQLKYYQQFVKAEHAFQVSFSMDFVERDCFSIKKPIIVPVSTFLSQLV